MEGEAEFILVVENGTIQALVNGRRVFIRRDQKKFKGNFGYAISSGTNAGFGTSCTFSRRLDKSAGELAYTLVSFILVLVFLLVCLLFLCWVFFFSGLSFFLPSSFSFSSDVSFFAASASFLPIFPFGSSGFLKPKSRLKKPDISLTRITPFCPLYNA